MAVLNFAHREITAKVVYFGAPAAGSSTNVRTLYEILPVEQKSQLHQFGPPEEEERTWYFDYVPRGNSDIQGFSLRFRVYAIPGGMRHAAHRREILRGTDAVVFVADARSDREQENLDSLLDLEGLLKEEGLEMAGMPMVLQVNRTDDEDARAADQVVFDLNPYGFPVIEAVARDSKGVLEAHEQVNTVTVHRIRDNLAGRETAITLTAVHQEDRDKEEALIERHMAATAAAEKRDREEVDVHEFDDLQTAGEVELPFQPADFAGTRPLRVIEAAIRGEDVHLDLIMEQPGGGTPRRLQVVLQNRQSSSPTSRSVTPVHDPSPSLLETLPDRIELRALPARDDLPPLWYGIAGLVSGVVIGLLTGVIFLL